MEINKVQMSIRAFGADVYQVLADAGKAQAWLRNFHDGLVYGIRGKSKLADQLLDEAQAYSQAQASRAKSRWAKKSSPNVPPSPPPELPEFYAYVAANDLDEAYAREWYDMCAARGWKDRDGNPILKWRGALTNYVKARVANAIADATKEEK